MSFGSKIRKLDVFKKIPEDITQATSRGGAVSLLTAIAIIAFIIMQIYNYLNPQYRSMIMTMRRQFRRKMKINLDITFPKVPCSLINIEMQDAVMSSNYQIKEIQKIELDQFGNQLQKSRRIKNQSDQYSVFQEAKRQLKRQDGCRMVGSFEVNEVPGVFRFVPFANQNVYALLMSQADDQQISVNFSHEIKLLSFGDSLQHTDIRTKHPKALLDPLTNTSQKFKKGSTTYFHYHLDIVPTFYRDGGSLIETYQYVWRSNTVPQYFYPVVYFQYQLGGLALQVHRDKQIQSQFIIKLCAVVGGTFTLASFLNNALEKLLNDRRKGYELIG